VPYWFPVTVELKPTGPENIGHLSWPEEEVSISPVTPSHPKTRLVLVTLDEDKTIVFKR
jgi:hypothetical protein